MRRKLPHFAGIPPQHAKALHQAVLEEILEQGVAPSRGLRRPRGVKRNQTKFRVIRSRGEPIPFDISN